MPAGTTRRLTQLLPWEVVPKIIESSDTGSGIESLVSRDLGSAELGSGLDAKLDQLAVLQDSDAGYCGQVLEG